MLETRSRVASVHAERRAAAASARVPAWIVNTISLYVECGIHPGGMLASVLADDIEWARCCHDHETSLRAISRFLDAARLPPTARGSRDAVAEWVRRGGLGGGLIA